MIIPDTCFLLHRGLKTNQKVTYYFLIVPDTIAPVVILARQSML